jgi:hypothetical protein
MTRRTRAGQQPATSKVSSGASLRPSQGQQREPWLSPTAKALLAVQRSAGNSAVSAALAGPTSIPDGRSTVSGALPIQREPVPGPSTATTEQEHQGPLRQRIQNWRAYAYQGLNDFAEGELENALNKTSEVDDASLGIAFATGLMDALAAANPIEGAILKPFFRKASAELLKAVGQHQFKSGPGAGSDRPIANVKRVLELVVEHTELALYDAVPTVVAEVRHDLQLLRPVLSKPTAADDITDEKVFDRSCIKMFGFEYVVGDGYKSEINPEPVRLLYQSQAQEKFSEYLKEVHPIGEGRWGHKKVVLVKVIEMPKDSYEDRTYAQATRRAVSDYEDEFEFLRWVDDDMVQAAEARMDAADEPVFAVRASRLKGLRLGSP